MDLHIHSAYSDGRGNIQAILNTVRSMGLDGLAITDHDTLEGYYEARSLSRDLLILPGYELETDAGHVLMLGLEQLPPFHGKMIYERLIGWARDIGGLTILAHPAAGRYRLHRWTQAKPDAIEALNASYPNEYFIRRGLKLAERLDLPTVGGSDAHNPKTVGCAYTVVDADDQNNESILEAIKAGSIKIKGKLAPIHNRLRIGIGYLSHKIIYKIKNSQMVHA